MAARRGPTCGRAGDGAALSDGARGHPDRLGRALESLAATAEEHGESAAAASAHLESAFHLSLTGMALAVGIPVAVALVLIALLCILTGGPRLTSRIGFVAAGGVLLVTALAGSVGLPASFVIVAVIVAAKVAVDVVIAGPLHSERSAGAAAQA